MLTFKVAVAAILLSTAVLAGYVAQEVVEPAPPVVHDLHMWVEQMEWEIHPGVNTTVWAYCAEGDIVESLYDGPCGVPGPTIRVRAGDQIRLTFDNTHTIDHTVHFHGWHPFEADMNGNAILGEKMVAKAGGTRVVQWTAEPAGSFIYHCHFDTPLHMDMGMYGAYIVEDRKAETPDVESVMVLDEWQIRPGELPRWNGNMPEYNFFTMSGKSFPLTQPIVAQPGDHVRIHMVNAGFEFHAMHLHGYTPYSWEGVAGPEAAFLTDVREIAPGQTVVLDFEADREGAWLFHDHVVPRVTAGSDGTGFGAYPRGMLSVLLVGDEYIDAVVGAVPALIEAARGDVSNPNAGHGEEPTDEDPEPGAPEAEPEGSAVHVDMANFAFQERTLEIAAGTQVSWKNLDGAVHTATDAGGAFDSGDLGTGASFEYRFDTPGTYRIYCKPHAYQDAEGVWQGMVMDVVVA